MFMQRLSSQSALKSALPAGQAHGGALTEAAAKSLAQSTQ